MQRTLALLHIPCLLARAGVYDANVYMHGTRRTPVLRKIPLGTHRIIILSRKIMLNHLRTQLVWRQIKYNLHLLSYKLNHCVFYHIVESISYEKTMSVYLKQSIGCWWPDDASSQGISSHCTYVLALSATNISTTVFKRAALLTTGNSTIWMHVYITLYRSVPI